MGLREEDGGRTLEVFMRMHEDFELLTRKDRTRITNAADKQFTSLEDFRLNAEEFLEREAA